MVNLGNMYNVICYFYQLNNVSSSRFKNWTFEIFVELTRSKINMQSFKFIKTREKKEKQKEKQNELNGQQYRINMKELPVLNNHSHRSGM